MEAAAAAAANPIHKSKLCPQSHDAHNVHMMPSQWHWQLGSAQPRLSYIDLPAESPISLDSPEDPGSTADRILLGVAIAASILFLFANAVIIANRRRTYFRALGGVDLILGSSVSGLIWVSSSFVVNQHFYRGPGILRVCALWSLWLQLTFGFCLWLVFLTMRLHRMQTLSIKGPEQERQSQRRAWTVLIPLFMIPAIAFCVLATVKDIIRFRHDSDLCKYETGWKMPAFLTLPVLYTSVVIFFLYKLRGKTDFLLVTEYKHTCEYVIMAIMIYLLSSVLYLTNEQYRISGRCFLTFCVCSLVFFDFWLHMGWPVLLCIFKRESEMDKFEEGSGARVLFTFASMRTHGVPSFPILSSEGAILEAVSTAIAEVERYKTKKEELEKEKNELEARKMELQKELALYANSKSL